MAVRVLFLFSILFGVVTGQALAHDIAVKNADSVTIYYNYINDGKELEVTFHGNSHRDYTNEYTGNVVIPEEVICMNRVWKVTSIGSDAFNVNSFFFYNEFIPTIISLIENPFALEPLFEGKARLNPPFTKKTYKKAKLFVPKGTIEKYKATKGWKRFKHIIECGADNA